MTTDQIADMLASSPHADKWREFFRTDGAGHVFLLTGQRLGDAEYATVRRRCEAALRSPVESRQHARLMARVAETEKRHGV